MHAAHASTEWYGARGRRHHDYRHRGPRGWEDLVAFMTGRGGPFGDPRMFKAFFFGPGGPGHHQHRGGRSRARRGDVRAALLLLISEHAQNGYQLIQEIERRTDGVWKPSPGSVYPALQQLEDEGLVRTVEFEGKRTYELTSEGREYVDSHGPELGDPFEAATGGMDEGVMDLRGLMFQVGAAAMQVAAAGHTEEARRILADTRRALYKVLAEDEPADEGTREV
ncbi:MAG TPA: PadR family transcriptional regulator [Solirubrobacter sp.]|nr:PadR family transcriptional regulator [Solirubrobacter sp.]